MEQLLQLERRVADLEAQLTQLLALHAASESLSPATILTTPVHIVTPEGKLIAAIEQQQNDHSFKLFNVHGHPVASLGVDGTHTGYLSIRNQIGTLLGLFDVELAGARLHLQDHAQQGGVVLFGGDSGSGSGGGININHTTGGISIELWSTPQGGELTIYTAPSEEAMEDKE